MGLTNLFKQHFQPNQDKPPAEPDNGQKQPHPTRSAAAETGLADKALPVDAEDGQLNNGPQTDFYRLVESSPYGFIIHTEHNVAFINKVGAGLLNATHPDQVVGKPITNFVHPNYRDIIKARITKISRDRKELKALEEKLVRLDGSDVDIEMTGLPFTYQNKPAAQLIINNITSRKKSEAELLERNRELTILQSAGAAITSTLDLRYVLDAIVEEMTKLLQIESCVIYEWRESKNNISMIAEYGPNGWWDSNTSAPTLYLADHPLRMWVLDEQVPQQLSVGQSGIDPYELAYMQTHHIKTLLLLPLESRYSVLGLVELKDSRFERSFSFQEISLVKFLATQAANAIENARLYNQAQQEITERQRAESALEQERALLAQRVKERTAELSQANAELARAARLKDEFLASMSHELRTPLNAILGASEILQEQIFGPLNEKQIRYLKNSEESGRHLLSLINDILDLSKIEAGKFEVHPGLVSVKSVCEASLRMVKELAQKKGLQVYNNFDPTVTKIQADEIRIKQILVNLLSNAVKFTPEGGQIGLDVTGDADQQVTRFTVWDTGIGIAQEDMERLFEPFVQLDSRLSREYVGTGLGLSLVSRMVELHGGGVSVESKVGEGSRFTISLPWDELAQPEPTTHMTHQQAGDNAQTINQTGPVTEPLILLAEDNEDNITTAIDYLEAQGYTTVVARNGEEAIARAQEDRPDIILMDVQMPGMDGLEATRRLRTDEAFANIPIIALTALAMPGDREKCLDAGATEYLSKPVSLKNLVTIINKFLA